MSKPSLMLGVSVAPEQLPAFEAFLRRAIPHYERLGGVRVRLLQSARDQREFLEIIECEDTSVLERETARTDHDAEIVPLIKEWRTLLAAGPTVETFIDRTPRVTPPPPALPVLQTERLRLRAFVPDDADRIAALAGDRRVAEMTLTIPHPYTIDDARAWLGLHYGSNRDDRERVYAICLCEPGGREVLVGAIGLMVQRAHHRAELGYWVGTEYWNRGIVTEAAAALVDHGFNALALRRIHSCHFGPNLASGRVMEKIGMKREGVLPAHICRFGVWHDSVLWGMSREMWEAHVARHRTGQGGA